MTPRPVAGLIRSIGRGRRDTCRRWNGSRSLSGSRDRWPTYDYDLFVIGAGSGGTRAARVAAAHGARVAVAEEYRVGGTCVIRGCVPKKLLVYGAHFAEDLKDAKRFGWDVPDDCEFDWPTLRDNVLAEVDRINGAYTDDAGEQRRRDHRTARGRHRPEQRHARRRQRRRPPRRILIAVGAHPAVPDCPGTSTASPRTRRSTSTRSQAHPDRGRGLYRQRVRRHLPPVRRARHPDEPQPRRSCAATTSRSATGCSRSRMMKGLEFRFDADVRGDREGRRTAA